MISNMESPLPIQPLRRYMPPGNKAPRPRSLQLQESNHKLSIKMNVPEVTRIRVTGSDMPVQSQLDATATKTAGIKPFGPTPNVTLSAQPDQGGNDHKDISPRGSLSTMTQESDDSSISPFSNRHIMQPGSRFSAEQNMGLTAGSNLEQRMQSLHADLDGELEQKSNSSSGSGSQDCGSSCYSRRSSVTSVGSEFPGEDAHKSMESYSILSPVEAGVFDEAASPCPPRNNSDTSNLSIEDWKNKPLPLEPVEPNPEPSREPSSFRRRRNNRQSPLASRSNSQRSVTRSGTIHRRDVHSIPYPLSKYRKESGRSSHATGRSSRPRYGHSSRHGHSIRQVPTLSQATEELESALADLAKDKHLSQRTLLVVDGPLQVSRHNGDLIATRPAPAPPATKRHSQLFGQISPESKKDKKNKPKKMDDTSDDAKPTTTTPNKETSNKPKFRNSFTFFNRKQNNSLRSSDDVQRLKTINSQSEISLGPSEGGGKDRRGSSQSDPSPCRELKRQSSKRDDLLLQLPRLKTDDLGLQNLIDSIGVNKEEHVRSRGNPTPATAPATQAVRPLAPPDDQKTLVSCDKMRQSKALVSTAQASSVHFPEHVFELDATPPSRASVAFELPAPKTAPVNLTFPVDMPESALVAIIERIDALDDLFNFAIVNKRFYTVFKARELALIKSTLFKMSPPAWELREMSPPWATEWQLLQDLDSQVPEYTPTLYLRKYAHDIYTLAQLKSLVLARCAPFLRRETVRGLAGMDPIRTEEVDDAFWRIWTFCRIFGSGKNRETDIVGQMDWLNGGVTARNINSSESSMVEPFGMNNVLFEPPAGFGRGNVGGLSQKQMYDMTEIWTCLGVLLQPLHGKCIEARRVGIFDGSGVEEGNTVREETVLEKWTSYITTLGLYAILTLSSLCPADTTTATFDKAKSIGLSKWEPTETNTSRSSFLKEAVSRAYELQESPSDQPSRTPRSRSSRNSDGPREHRERQTAFANELRDRRNRGQDETNERFSFADERPMSEYSTILRGLGLQGEQPPPVPPVPALLVDHSDTASTRSPYTPNRSPVPSESWGRQSQRSSMAFSLAPAPLRPQVLDPVDRAINMMVNELGFLEEDAKWALKITDTGEGIDVSAAVQLLQRQRKKSRGSLFSHRRRSSNTSSLLTEAMKRRGSHDSLWRWA